MPEAVNTDSVYALQANIEKTDITNAIMHCIAKDMLPISTVKKEGFKRLINLIDPRYVLPGHKRGTILLKVSFCVAHIMKTNVTFI